MTQTVECRAPALAVCDCWGQWQELLSHVALEGAEGGAAPQLPAKEPQKLGSWHCTCHL